MAERDMTAIRAFGRDFDLTNPQGADDFQRRFNGFEDAESCGLGSEWCFAETTASMDIWDRSHEELRYDAGAAGQV